jgi:hypothetical protein
MIVLFVFDQKTSFTKKQIIIIFIFQLKNVFYVSLPKLHHVQFDGEFDGGDAAEDSAEECAGDSTAPKTARPLAHQVR